MKSFIFIWSFFFSTVCAEFVRDTLVFPDSSKMEFGTDNFLIMSHGEDYLVYDHDAKFLDTLEMSPARIDFVHEHEDTLYFGLFNSADPYFI